MTQNQLLAFVLVGKYRNVTAAARELCVTQSAVSRQLRLLEEKLGERLYTRRGNGVELTVAGERFLADARGAVSCLERVRRKWSAREDPEGRTDSLEVGGSHGPSAILLPSAMVAFRRRHPQLDVSLRTDHSRAIEGLVLGSEIEIALITNPSGHPRLAVLPFRREKLVVFASAKNPLAKKDSLSLKELAEAVRIVRQGNGGGSGTERVLKQLQKRGLSPRLLRCGSAEAVKTQVRMGAGLGILYQDQVAPELEPGSFRRMRVPELDLTAESFLVSRKDRGLSKWASEFVSLLHRRASQPSFSGSCEE
jgi:DNA-binding transcriptional LysR family regulator